MKEIDRIRILSGLEPSKTKEEQINEGWIQNLAAAVMMLSATVGASQTASDLPYDEETMNHIEAALEDPQVIDKLKEMGVEDNNIARATKRFVERGHKVDRIKVKKIIGDKELAKYLRMGYHLTSVQTDTIIKLVPKIAPESVVEETVLNFSDDAFFASGKFILGDEEKYEIKQALNSIDASGSILLNIVVESSTDKQGLSKRLEKTLLSLGYEGNNNGLSQARNDAIMGVLETQGVDSSLIEQLVLAEQGEGVINPSTRYVKVRIQALEIIVPTAPGETDMLVSYPQTFEVVKAFTKLKKHKPSTGKTCKASITKFKKGQILCPVF